MESILPPRQGRRRALVWFLAFAGLGVMAVVAWQSWRIGVEHWYIAKLESEDPETRENAARRLTAMASIRAVPYLIEALARLPELEEEIEFEWINAGPFSDAILAAGVGALPGLERKLRSEAAMERFWAAHMTGLMGHEREGTAASLFPLLSDEDPQVRHQAAWALGVVGCGNPSVLQSLGEALWKRANSPELRESSLEALAAAAEIAKGFLNEGEEDFDARRKVSEVVSAVLASLASVIEEEDGAIQRKIVSAFLDALVWSDRTYRPWAPFDPEPALSRLAADRDPTVRARAVGFLAMACKFSAPALAALARALGDPEADVRRAARLELKVRGPEALPVWIAALGPDHPLAWEAAAEALAAMGAAARPAWPLLLERLLDAREDSAPSLARALGMIGTASGIGVPELTSALKSPAAAARRGAAAALGHYGMAASAAGPALLEALRDGDPSVRRAAALAIVSTRGVPLETLSEKAVPILAACLGDEDPLLWWRAGDALAALGPAAKGAVPALTRALRDRHGLVNPWALRAVEAIGPDAAAAVPAVLSILAENDAKSHPDAVRALRAIGPGLAIPALAEPR